LGGDGWVGWWVLLTLRLLCLHHHGMKIRLAPM